MWPGSSRFLTITSGDSLRVYPAIHAPRRARVLEARPSGMRPGLPERRDGEGAPRSDLNLTTGLRSHFRALGSVSGNLRAVGSPRIDDLGSPRGKGRGKIGARPGAPPPRRVTGRRSFLAIRESGDQEAKEVARDGPVEAVADDAGNGVFGGVPAAGSRPLVVVASRRHVERCGLARGSSGPLIYTLGVPRPGSDRKIRSV